MKYRIKNVEMMGYFVQVKRSFFGGWKTIGKHTHGFGEYEENHLSYPIPSRRDAVLLANLHADYEKAKKGYTVHEYIKIR